MAFGDFFSSLGDLFTSAPEVFGDAAGGAGFAPDLVNGLIGGGFGTPDLLGAAGTGAIDFGQLGTLPSLLGQVQDILGSGAGDVSSLIPGLSNYSGSFGDLPNLLSQLRSSFGGAAPAASVDGAISTPSVSAFPGISPSATTPAPSAASAPAPWSATPATDTVDKGAGISTGPGITPGQGAGSQSFGPAPRLSIAPTGGPAVAPSGGGGVTPPPSASDPGFLGGVSNFLRQNAPLLSAAAGVGAIGKQLLAPSSIPNLSQMTAAGTAANKAAQDLIPSVSTGKLPAGAEQMVQNATNDAITGIRAKYANLGLSGSTMEQQDIAAAQQRAQAMRFDLAQQLTQTGLNAAGLQEQIYSQIANLVLNQDKGLSDALAAFAQAMGGSQALQTQQRPVVAAAA